MFFGRGLILSFSKQAGAWPPLQASIPFVPGPIIKSCALIAKISSKQKLGCIPLFLWY